MDAVITDEEKARIEALDLADDPQVGAKPWFKRARRGVGNWRLTHRPDGGCVFLTTENHCRLQERFGAEVKPFVCRLFPFLLIPAGNHWARRYAFFLLVGTRPVPGARPVAESEKDLVNLSRLLEHHVGRTAESAPAPLLQAGQQLPWADVCRVVQVLVEIVQDRGDRLERRLRKCLAVARVCEKTQFLNLQGSKLTKYLQAQYAAPMRMRTCLANLRICAPPLRPALWPGPVPCLAGDFCAQR